MTLEIDQLVNGAREAGWDLSSVSDKVMIESGLDFAAFEVTGSRSPQTYMTRIAPFCSRSGLRALDAGCGIGQWSLAMKQVGFSVISVELRADRAMFASELKATGSSEKNSSLLLSDISKLPFGEGCFDFVFCYGVLMFSRIDETLATFRRVSRSGSQLYVNALGSGWFLYLLFKRPELRKGALVMLLRTLTRQKSGIFLTRRSLVRRVEQAGFQVIYSGAEGSHANALPAFYKPTFMGLPTVFEVVARVGQVDVLDD